MSTTPSVSAAPVPASGLRRLPRNVWVVTITSFLTDISSEMLVHLLPLFLANVLGVRTSIIGLIEGVAETTASLLKLYSGWLSDKLGQRKWLTVAGYGLSTLAKPFFYVATTWGGLLAVRFADRVGKGIRTAPRDALIADSIDERQRGLAFGLHRAGDTAGAALGLLIALGAVYALQGGNLQLTQSTFRTIVLISIVPALLAVLVLAFGAREVPVDRQRQPPRFSLAGFDARFKAYLVTVLLFTLGNSTDAFLILRAQERGLSVTSILAMFVAFNVIYAVLSGPAGALSDRIGRQRLIVGGWLIYGLIYLGMAVVQTGTQVWALVAFYGVYYAMFEGTGKALVADLVRPEQRGTAFGLYNGAVGLAALPASLVAGVLWQGVGGWQGFGPGAPFLFGAVLALLAAALLVFWVRPQAALAR